MALMTTKQSREASDRFTSESTSQKLFQPLESSETHASSSNPALSPHDATVKQINEQLLEIQQANPGLSNSESDLDLQHEARCRDPQDKACKHPQEPLIDLFDGQNIGTLTPGEMNKAEDDIWTHLARIRGLQSEIAKLHSHMEGLGEVEISHKVEHTADDETINVDEETKAAKDAEFQRLSSWFEGRNETVDDIMSKLDSLSHAINDFHSARPPVFPAVSMQNDAPGPS